MFSTSLLETKMTSLPYFLISNIIIAIAVYLCCELGRLLGVPSQPLAISVFWPSAGFALACVLILGYKTWPGILLGNFIYNYSHFSGYEGMFVAPLIAAVLISLGSLLQALAGGYIIRRYSSPSLFNNVRDIFVFLLPGGVFACLIASTIGVLTLHFFGFITDQSFPKNWLTFWVGDSVGVYLFTPLLVVWLTKKPLVEWSAYKWESVVMVAAFLILSACTIFFNLPVGQLFIPLALWVAYRYRMHGASLAVLLISLAILIPLSLGYGIYNTLLTVAPLLIMVSFIEIISITTFILAAVTNEREAALNLLRRDNRLLQNSLAEHKGELEEIQSEIVVKDKMASFSLVTHSLAQQMHNPLTRMNNFIKSSMEDMEHLKQMFDMYQKSLEPEASKTLSTQIEHLESEINKLSKSTNHATRIYDVLEKHSSRADPATIKISSINVHTFLNAHLEQIIAEKSKHFPGFNLTIIREYDRNIDMIQGMPEDLTEAFLYIFDRSMNSMKEKKNKLKSNYEPTLLVSTHDGKEEITITIRDNGMGIPDYYIPEYFLTTLLSEQLIEREQINLFLAYDIIFHLHNGDIKVESEEGEYLQFTIILPKSHKKTKMAA